MGIITPKKITEIKMELKLKAYKCIFPNFFIDAYNIYMWQDDKQFEVIYGRNQREAVRAKCQKDECYGYWELKRHIKTRRYPERDLYSQGQSELLNGLNENEIGHLTHCLGIKVGQVCPRDFYRNYSLYYDANPEFNNLIELGLVRGSIRNGSYVYSVTDIGIGAVKTLLLNTIDKITPETK